MYRTLNYFTHDMRTYMLRDTLNDLHKISIFHILHRFYTCDTTLDLIRGYNP